ncbi:MAG: Ig-like domain-containing protein [Pseudonocardiaceae bacterium]
MVAIAAVTTLLLIGGVTNAEPAGGTFQLTSVAPATTATKLVTFPVAPVVQGSMVQLTATVTPAAPGTVQFKDGTADLGNPVIVSNGTASGTISQLPTGSRQLTAVFTPTDQALFIASTSPVVPFEVTVPAKQATDTRTALTTSPSSSIDRGAAVTLVATVTPAAAPGTVQFKDGTANVGTPVTVSNGSASTTTLQLPVGTRRLTAVFSPTDPATFNPSTSPVVSLTVIDSSQTVTSQAQQSGQSLDGSTVLDGQGLTVLDLGGANDGRGVTLLDGGNAGAGPGLTVLDLGGVNDSRLNDRRGLTVLDGRGLTVLRTGGDGGLLSNLLRGLL